MTELLPTLQARRIQEGIVDFLSTTFALADAEPRAALQDFLTHPDSGIFRGPYVRLRMPFLPADQNWHTLLDWEPPFPPYRHQAEAYARLTSKGGRQPQPTIVTTGTGSGKTEAFLHPVLDHVVRAKQTGQRGVKALILYPMNALADDQARRLTDLLVTDPALKDVTAGLYTGTAQGRRTQVSADGLITAREVMRQDPPDILLTNYKMLDQLLLRAEDQGLWALSAESLTYLVLDEFHTYDGAQGTDVAMLLRRLGLALKANLPAGHPDLALFEQAALGRVTPVATSATLGDGGDPTDMLHFAETVFGRPFPADAAVTEYRLSADTWAQAAHDHLDQHDLPTPTPVPLAGLLAADLDDLAALAEDSGLLADAGLLTVRVLTRLFTLGGHPLPDDLAGIPARHLIRLHPDVRTLIEHAADARSLTDLATALVPRSTGDSEQSGRVRRALAVLIAALSHLRASLIEGRPDRDALTVEVTLWLRAVTRLDRAAAAEPRYRWADDGPGDGDPDQTTYLPAIYCRGCGRSGWMVELAPTGRNLAEDDESIRRHRAQQAGRVRALLHAPGEAAAPTPPSNLRWLSLAQRAILTSRPSDDDLDLLEGLVLPVLMFDTDRSDRDDTKSHHDTCPSCAADDHIRFIGSAVATLMSVTITTVFGEPTLEQREKRTLVFTDSVQDAAHRAGFIGSRSHTMALRAALRSALDDAPGAEPVTVRQWVQDTMRAAEADPFDRYRLVPNSLLDHPTFQNYWNSGLPPAKARSRVEDRLLFDAILEVGLQSTYGRTLEATGSIGVQVALGSDIALIQLAQQVLLDDPTQPLPHDPGRRRQLVQWVRGTVEHLRREGGIDHRWFLPYKQHNGIRYKLWGGRPARDKGMPAFPPGRSVPRFAVVGGNGGDKMLLARVTPTDSWYARWTAKVLDEPYQHAAALARGLLESLTRLERLTAIQLNGGSGTVYGIPSDGVLVQALTDQHLASGQAMLVCDTCRTPLPTTPEVNAQLREGRCLVHACPGHLHQAPVPDSFYRALYAGRRMHRVTAREHSSLLEPDERAEVERGFKQSEQKPGDPNVLVATPTLEMGIDIGDLSTVLLAGLPDTVAKYLQRVGRGGRLSGSSLNLAFIPGRRDQLSQFASPTTFINGSVRSPATYLDAEEILRRQFLAFVIDRIARTPSAWGQLTGFDGNRMTAHGVLGAAGECTLLHLVVTTADREGAALVDEFAGTFAQPDAAGLRALADWVAGGDPDNCLADTVYRAHRDYVTELEHLTRQIREIDASLPELERLAALPGATEDDQRAPKQARGALAATRGLRHRLQSRYWIEALENAGLLPNYTLVDDSVHLEAQVFWRDPDNDEFHEEAWKVDRASSRALREFAPGSHFYARGLHLEVDGVDLGRDGSLRRWVFCDECGYVHDRSATAVDEPRPAACPRCGSAGIADAGQGFTTLRLQRVFSEVWRDSARIADDEDDRERVRFEIAVLPDFDPTRLQYRWSVQDAGIEVAHYRNLTMRWANFGRPAGGVARLGVAGFQTVAHTFRVCEACGKLDRDSGSNSPDEHRLWCRHRKSSEEHVLDLVLTRQLSTEAVVLSLPPRMTDDHLTVPSLSAALRLGMKEELGGGPTHLALERVNHPVVDGAPGQVRTALLLHDTVPGGTGYLAELADPERLRAVLRSAHRLVSECPCQHEQRAACHRCLLPFVPPDARDHVYRSVAQQALAELLLLDEPGAEAGWIVTDKPLSPGSGESDFEHRVRRSLREEAGRVGHVQEKPSPGGTRLTFTGFGGGRTWHLTPQVDLFECRPDYLLEYGGPQRFAIFADGAAYHASLAHNRLSEDATKRQRLRAEGVQVLALSQDDLTGTDTGWWVDDAVISQLMAGKLAPAGSGISTAAVEEQRAGPLALLMGLLRAPHSAPRTALANLVPWVLARTSQQATLPEGADLAEQACRWLTQPPDAGGGTVLVHRQPHLVLASRLDEHNSPREIVLILDDTTEALATPDHRRAWRHWLHLSNALMSADVPVRILTRTLVEQGAAPATAPAAPPAQLWPGVSSDDLLDEAEVELAVALTAAGAAKPEIGIESGPSGVMLTFAWPEHMVATVLGEAPVEYDDVDGWTVAPADAAAIIQMLSERRG